MYSLFLHSFYNYIYENKVNIHLIFENTKLIKYNNILQIKTIHYESEHKYEKRDIQW